MVYIRKHMRKGKAYYSVVESFREKGRVRQRIIHYIGSEIEYSKFLESSLTYKELLTAELENLLYGSIVSLYKLSEELNLKEIFSKHFKKEWGIEPSLACIIMILNYALERKSKRKIQEWYKQTYLKYLLNIEVKKINKDLLCRTLDFFDENNIGTIHSEIYEKAKERFNLSNKKLYYDLTAVTFEGKKCNLAKKGYKPEGVYKLQVNIGLTTTEERFPITHKTFEGNAKDVTTFEKIIAIIEKISVLSNIIFIFDRGISSEKNRGLIKTKGGKYISGLSKTNCKKLILSLKEENFSKIDENISFYEIKENNERIIIYWNKKMQEDQKKLRGEKLQKIMKQLEKLKKNLGRYRKERIHEKIGLICGKFRSLFNISVKDSFNFSINEKKLKELEMLEGKYAIITNTELTASEVLQHYRDKNLIEMSFKDLKLFVHINPVRHSKDNRVLAHVFLAVIAFGLRALLELKLKRKNVNLSAQEAINKLNKVRSLVANGKLLKLTGEDEETLKIASIINN